MSVYHLKKPNWRAYQLSTEKKRLWQNDKPERNCWAVSRGAQTTSATTIWQKSWHPKNKDDTWSGRTLNFIESAARAHITKAWERRCRPLISPKLPTFAPAGVVDGDGLWWQQHGRALTWESASQIPPACFKPRGVGLTPEHSYMLMMWHDTLLVFLNLWCRIFICRLGCAPNGHQLFLLLHHRLLQPNSAALSHTAWAQE